MGVSCHFSPVSCIFETILNSAWLGSDYSLEGAWLSVPLVCVNELGGIDSGQTLLNMSVQHLRSLGHTQLGLKSFHQSLKLCLINSLKSWWVLYKILKCTASLERFASWPWIPYMLSYNEHTSLPCNSCLLHILTNVTGKCADLRCSVIWWMYKCI